MIKYQYIACSARFAHKQLIKMDAFDNKVVILNDGEKDVKVMVYLKRVNVRNGHTNLKSFCRIVKD